MRSKYALAVEIEEGLYEIFDILYFEKDTDIDKRYRKSISMGSKAIVAPDLNNIKIGSILVDNKFIIDNKEGVREFNHNDIVYVFLSNNKIFGIMSMDKSSIDFAKYNAAFDGNVIIVDVSEEDSVGLGDIWHSSKNSILK
jgi:hypothetical protein